MAQSGGPAAPNTAMGFKSPVDQCLPSWAPCIKNPKRAQLRLLPGGQEPPSVSTLHNETSLTLFEPRLQKRAHNNKPGVGCVCVSLCTYNVCVCVNACAKHIHVRYLYRESEFRTKAGTACLTSRELGCIMHIACRAAMVSMVLELKLVQRKIRSQVQCHRDGFSSRHDMHGTRWENPSIPQLWRLHSPASSTARQ